MAVAKISMADGISVEVNGTPEEVTAVLENLQRKQRAASSQVSPSRRLAKNKGEIPSLIDALKSEDFFRTPRGLSAIQNKLAELGHHYPVTTLSGAMQSQSRSRNLRRFKQHGKYVYVQ